jgi:hypothetical protein
MIDEEDSENPDEEFNLFDEDFEKQLDAGYDKIWQFDPEEDFFKKLRESAKRDGINVKKAGGGFVFEKENANKIKTASEFYTNLLYLVCLKEYTDLYLVYNARDQLRFAATKNGRGNVLSNEKVPAEVPQFLEDALNEIYNCEVRELGADDKKEEIHIILNPKTQEPIGAFKSYLSRVALKQPGAHGYHISIEITQKPSNLEEICSFIGKNKKSLPRKD